MKKQRKTTFIALFSMLTMVLVGTTSVLATRKQAHEVNAASQTTTISTIAAREGWTNGTKYLTFTDGAFTFTVTKTGANSGKYYTSGTNWRFYSSESGELEITGDSTVSAISQVSSSPSVTWAIDGKVASFVATANANFTSFTITYTPVGQSFGTLDRIEMDTDYVQTEFALGDTFNHDNLSVMAYDTAGMSINVSNLVTTDYDGVVFGSQHLGANLITVFYESEQDTYSINVAEYPIYKEIKSVSEIKLNATYTIAAKDVELAITEPQGIDNYFGYKPILLQEDDGYQTFVGSFNTLIFKLVRGSLAGTYSFEILNGSRVGKYIAAPTGAGDNHLLTIDSIEDRSSWNLQNYPDINSVSISTRYIRYNATTPRFSTYTSPQTAVQLYVDEDTIPVETFGSLHHIEIATELAKTSYFVGESYSSAGLIVTGYDGADSETANEISITNFTTSPEDGYVFKSVGGFDVTVTATVDGVTKDKDYEIEISEGRTFDKVTSQSDLFFKHTYTFATEGEAMSSVVSNFANPIDINYADGSFTEVTQLLTVSLEIGKIKGSYAFKILSGASAGKYLAYTNDSTKLSQVTEVNDNASWFIVFEEGDYVHIASAISENRGLVYNETNIRFAAYAHTYEGNAQTFLYAESSIKDASKEALALATEVNDGIGEGAAGNCYAVYDFLKDVYDRLSVAGRAAFVTTSPDPDIAAAAARYAYIQDWVLANPNPDGSPSILDITSSQTITIVIIISVLGISTLAGYYFIRKRPKEEKAN